MDKSNTKTNKHIAQLFRSIAAVYLIKNEIRFKILAYQNAADIIEKMTEEVYDLWKQDKLDKIPGIGLNLAKYLDEYFRKGKSTHFENILNQVPASIFEFMKIPGIGPKKAYKLAQILNIKEEKNAINKLKKAAESRKIEKLSDFGIKSQESIIESIKIFEKKKYFDNRMPLPYAYRYAQIIVDYLKRNTCVQRIDLLGSLRRMTETIGDIDISVKTSKRNMKQLIDYFIKYPKKISIDNAGQEKASIITFPNIRVDLRLQEGKQYGSMLQYLTGSKTHNIKLREFGLKKRYSLSEYSIKDLKNRKNYYFEKEEDFYNFLGLQYIPAELREGTNEIELAEKHKLPNLIELKDIKGDMHIHSNYDLKPSHDLGKNSYVEIYKKALQKNYSYIGFTDHNPKITGLSEKEIIEILNKRKKYIDISMQKVKSRKLDYFTGLEVDILINGELAIPKKALSLVDFLVIGIHSAFNMNKTDMTKRILNGLDHEKAKILAHPTGRKFAVREGYDLNWNEIFKYCKEKNVAIEINSWPERLDLSYDKVKEGINNKNKFIINTDSHDVSHMDLMTYGVSVARKGFATKNDIINAYNLNDFIKWIRG